MILPTIQEIKKKRVALGVSQKSLAAAVGISQSLIAKIETGRVSPSYSSIKRIFEYFDGIELPGQSVARDVEKKDLVWLRKGEKVKDAAEKMRLHGFSQLPIRDDKDEICVGSISERQIIHELLEAQNPKEFYEKQVSEIMVEQFPVVDENIPVNAVALLLQHSQAVLTARKGRIVGIITPSDLLSAASQGTKQPRRASSSRMLA